MITNAKKVSIFFTIFLILWIFIFLATFGLILYLKDFNYITTILLTIFLIISFGFYWIKVYSIDATGLGITYISQPYVFKAMGSGLFLIKKEFNSDFFQSIDIKKGLLGKIKIIISHQQNKNNIILYLLFFDNKMRHKIEGQIINFNNNVLAGI